MMGTSYLGFEAVLDDSSEDEEAEEISWISVGDELERYAASYIN